MGLAIRVIFSAFSQCVHRIERVVVGTLVAALVGFPIFILAGFVAYGTNSVQIGAIVAAVLFGILPNPANAGMQLMARDLAAGEYLLMPGPFEGVRRFWRPALRFWLIGIPVTAVLGFNSVFYTQVHFPASPVAEIISLYLLAAWIAAHVYVYPLIIEQEVKSVRLVYRNAFVIVLTHPLFTLQVAAVWLLVLLITSASGVIVAIGLALGASIQQNATARILPTFAEKRVEEEGPATS
jgi:uncharacterized membrane protein YesL